MTAKWKKPPPPSPAVLRKRQERGRVLIKRGRQRLLSGEEQTSQIGAVSSAFGPKRFDTGGGTVGLFWFGTARCVVF